MIKFSNPFNRNQNQQNNAPERFSKLDIMTYSSLAAVTSVSTVFLANNYFNPGKLPSYTPEPKQPEQALPNSNFARKKTLDELSDILAKVRELPANSKILLPGNNCVQATATRTDCTSPRFDQTQIDRNEYNIELIQAVPGGVFNTADKPIFPIYPTGNNSTLSYTPSNTPYAAGIIDPSGVPTGAVDSLNNKQMQPSKDTITVQFTFDDNPTMVRTQVSSEDMPETVKFEKLIAALKIK